MTENISLQVASLPPVLFVSLAIAVVLIANRVNWKVKAAQYRCICGHLLILHKESEFASMHREEYKYEECTDNSCAYSCKRYEAM